MKNILPLVASSERPNQRTRSGPQVFTNILRLPIEDSGLSHSIIRFSNNHIGDKKIPRRTAVVIKNTANQKWIIRYAMGNNGSVKALNKQSIAVDYDAIHELGVRYEQPVHLVVKKARLHQCMTWLLYSPDLNVRLSFRFAVLGAALGVLSLLIAFPV